jgi:uncharacterized protein (TIGR02246 family)
MDGQASKPQDTSSTDEDQVRALYRRMLDGWNARDADVFAATFAEDGESIGFDGSQMSGRAEIAASLRGIFADHTTVAYVAKVRRVRFLAPEVAHLLAVVGMVPPGRSDIESRLNAEQTLVTVKRDGQWRIAFLQNTPAQFHGRPELVQHMTDELRRLL